MLLQRLIGFLLVAGAGKSVLWYDLLPIYPSWELIMLASSAIIQDIDAMRKAGLASLAMFYFDHKDTQKKNWRGLLSSLLVQLCCQSDSYYRILFHLYNEHSNGVRTPSDGALVGCLKGLLKVSGPTPVYLILDALDECSNASRKEVLELLEELVNSQFPHLRICVTSRLGADTLDVRPPLALRSISLHDESGHKDDIDNYIKSFVNTDAMMQSWKEDDKEWVTKVLIEHADGR
jgi:hypothetical protein